LELISNKSVVWNCLFIWPMTIAHPTYTNFNDFIVIGIKCEDVKSHAHVLRSCINKAKQKKCKYEKKCLY
jgi:hypothetical protein